MKICWDDVKAAAVTWILGLFVAICVGGFFAWAIWGLTQEWRLAPACILSFIAGGIFGTYKSEG